ncbi:S66 peptidase family protein [Larsenimonas rhizosphaerae]|uniref:S66 peptidase family protein n=1 Tax=Larsenimonas rhizosphaerae TaxID=2944682 RepID=UPI00203425D8|nr:LD-carboxypeptidase [Larsenimonas rhizosphaerae]MCM2130893.1 LD-carboxypeptidase [Larsenimonas rhizosphaerae]
MPLSLVAPSGALDSARLEGCIRALKDQGIHFTVGRAVRARHRAMAGTVIQRIDDLHASFDDSHGGPVWALRGGYGGAQLLKQIDWQRLSVERPLIGYSDLTALLESARRHGRYGIHGPVLTEWCIHEEHDEDRINRQTSLDSVARILEGQLPRFEITPLILDAPLKGTVVGGNLTVLASLCGTPWALSPPSHSLLILEDVGEPLYRLERSLCQLLDSLPDEAIQAIVLGEFVRCPGAEHDELIAMMTDHLTPRGIALASGLPVGHGPRNMAWPYGHPALLDLHSLDFNTPSHR